MIFIYFIIVFHTFSLPGLCDNGKKSSWNDPEMMYSLPFPFQSPTEQTDPEVKKKDPEGFAGELYQN